MVSFIKTVKVIRNNWKKSTFLAVVVAWGGSYTKHHFDTQNLMRTYCEKAVEYGNQTLPVTVNPRQITVILNPNANKRKAQTEFEKYCAPLLHLAGVSVDIVKTESDSHARNIIDNLKGAEAIVVAGGDGTLSEVVTGLMRRTNENAAALVPIGVLPLGRHNTVGGTLFPGVTKLEKIKSLADATMAVIEQVTKPMDIMRIEVIGEEDKKPVYAVAGLKWGAYRDAEVRKETYWYFGGLKKYATYLFNGLKNNISWNCQAQVLYSPPCAGCSNCYKVQNTQPKPRWFQSLVHQNNDDANKYYQIDNPRCQQQLERTISTSDLMLFTSNVIPSQIRDVEVSKLNLFIGPARVDYVDFVKQGWKSEQGENREIAEAIEARTIEINPRTEQNKQLWYSIDSEEFEVKPIRVTLLPKILQMYCKKEQV